MRNIVLAVLALSLLGGCGWLKKQPKLKPVIAAGCNAETKILAAAGGKIADALACTSPEAIVEDLKVAMGNVSFCKMVQPEVSGLAARGLVGSIVCQYAVSTVVGYLTSHIPERWGCTAEGDVPAIMAQLTLACAGAIPVH